MNKQNNLKFRVFDKMRKEYIYPESPGQQHFILTLNGKFYNLQNGSGGDEYVVERYINKKDENGKDVYTGDVLENEEGTWLLGDNSWKRIKFSGQCGYDKTPFFGRVIGNVNENPELLN